MHHSLEPQFPCPGEQKHDEPAPQRQKKPPCLDQSSEPRTQRSENGSNTSLASTLLSSHIPSRNTPLPRRHCPRLWFLFLLATIQTSPPIKKTFFGRHSSTNIPSPRNRAHKQTNKRTNKQTKIKKTKRNEETKEKERRVIALTGGSIGTIEHELFQIGSGGVGGGVVANGHGAAR